MTEQTPAIVEQAQGGHEQPAQQVQRITTAPPPQDAAVPTKIKNPAKVAQGRRLAAVSRDAKAAKARREQDGTGFFSGIVPNVSIGSGNIVPILGLTATVIGAYYAYRSYSDMSENAKTYLARARRSEAEKIGLLKEAAAPPVRIAPEPIEEEPARRRTKLNDSQLELLERMRNAVRDNNIM